MSYGHTVKRLENGGAFIEGDEKVRLQKLWVDKDDYGRVLLRAEWLKDKDSTEINEWVAYFGPAEAMRLAKAFETVAIAALKESS